MLKVMKYYHLKQDISRKFLALLLDKNLTLKVDLEHLKHRNLLKNLNHHNNNKRNLLHKHNKINKDLLKIQIKANKLSQIKTSKLH